VLVNVYRHLLHTDLTREGVALEAIPDRNVIEAALFVAVEHEVSPVNAWSYRGYVIRQLRLLWPFAMGHRPHHAAHSHQWCLARLGSIHQQAIRF
jgi:hypothetical protein